METLPIINSTYEVYKIIADIGIHLEKRWRYSLGQKLEQSILDALSDLIMAQHAPKQLKSAYLIKANARLEIATLQLRLCLELKLCNETKIFQVQAHLRETGRMLGGWLKSLQTLTDNSPTAERTP